MVRPAAPGAPETILCDTSLVSVVQTRGVPAAWPPDTCARLDTAILAITVVTLAELRDGHIYANWGPRRRAAAEQLIAAYLWLALDMAIVSGCAHLRAAGHSRAVTAPDIEIWSAATASSRGWPLASCDKHFDAIPDVDHIGRDSTT